MKNQRLFGVLIGLFIIIGSVGATGPILKIVEHTEDTNYMWTIFEGRDLDELTDITWDNSPFPDVDKYIIKPLEENRVNARLTVKDCNLPIKYMYIQTKGNSMYFKVPMYKDIDICRNGVPNEDLIFRIPFWSSSNRGTHNISVWGFAGDSKTPLTNVFTTEYTVSDETVTTHAGIVCSANKVHWADSNGRKTDLIQNGYSDVCFKVLQK